MDFVLVLWYNSYVVKIISLSERTSKMDFVKVAATNIKVSVADCVANSVAIINKMAELQSAHLVCFQELCITGYTCADLFLQEKLQKSALYALQIIEAESAKYNTVYVVGLPIKVKGKLYNVGAVLCKGKVLGFVPKTHLPNYGEFYEMRHFASAPKELCTVSFFGEEIPFGTNLLFKWIEQDNFVLALEICEDFWSATPPSTRHTLNGATIVCNLSASNETVGKAEFRQALVKNISQRLVCGYIYANTGFGESTTDTVYAGHQLIAENGYLLAETKPFAEEPAVADIDLYAISYERGRMNTFSSREDNYNVINFSMPKQNSEITRKIDARPFIPHNTIEWESRCEMILKLQSMGLVQRLAHTKCEKAVVGISGGLDSTLALLCMCRAFSHLQKPLSNIVAVTMPCFGTSVRTRTNADLLCEALGVTLREIDIHASVNQHFKDIGHDAKTADVTFENAQARMRTLILMDLANKENGIVVGTGDLSELALGFATYNGDHMSMYGINAGVPKTLVRALVEYEACRSGGKLEEVLRDIIDTPVSPELLPSEQGSIDQQTEEIVGPYDLHDFFLYHTIRWGRCPTHTFEFACLAFNGEFDKPTIKHWLILFYKRFFAQQYKRSCMPDGTKIGSVTLSPRADWRMPSDASSDMWVKEAEEITI